jgi:predicted glycoside hydrolase/deacetylase ChbG (UPF0249 family)
MIILCADDYGLAGGVSRAIAELASKRRISATSAIVTLDDWPEAAPGLAALRGVIAVGVHLNLTFAGPLGPMPQTAPSGTLPSVDRLILRALTGRLDEREITAEFVRQFERFEAEVGHSPDHIDGHQHIHAFPIIRRALIAAISTMNWTSRPLVRAPSDRVVSILARRYAIAKALMISALSRGLRNALARADMPTNDTFAGISAFDQSTDFRTELTGHFNRAGQCHLVMCHPGHVDAGLRARDPVVERRAQEYDALMTAVGLPPRIWHPDRSADGAPVDWKAAS